MKARLDFAKKYKDMPLSYWRKVLWSDESKFNLKASDGIQKVWRKPGEAYKLSCTRGTVKHGGGNIMVWGSMAYNGVGKLHFIDETMNADLYISILESNLKSSARLLRLGSNFVFQQDTAKKTVEFLEEQNVNVLDWPSQSPDLNPIENLWSILDRKIGERSFTRKEALKEAVQKAWCEMDIKQTKSLVESMPTRLRLVIEAKGGPTKY